jgi:anti-sigma-K factor RskA
MNKNQSHFSMHARCARVCVGVLATDQPLSTASQAGIETPKEKTRLKPECGFGRNAGASRRDCARHRWRLSRWVIIVVAVVVVVVVAAAGVGPVLPC